MGSEPGGSRGAKRPAIIDSSCLCCFGRARRLDLLNALLGDRRKVVARAVLEEIEVGCDRHPELGDVRRSVWLEQVSVDGLAEMRSFAELVRLFGAGTRDIGECSTLAWAEVNGGISVVDDQIAVEIARDRGVEVRRTLALVAEGVRSGLLDDSQAVELVDALRGGGGRFPCSGGEFVEWASDMGLLSSVGGPTEAPEARSVASDGETDE